MKGSGSVASRETQDEIVRLYVHEALSMRQIGQRVHWSSSTVRRVLAARGIERRAGGGAYRLLPQDQLDKVMEMYLRGHSTRVIGRDIGIAASTVRHRLRRAGVEMRTWSEATELAHRANVAEVGVHALSSRQQRALEILEANHSPLLTEQVAHRMRTGRQNAYAALKRLRDLGLATSKRETGAPYRRCTWKRTQLPISDIVDAALNPVARRGRGDLMLPIEPFREWISGLVAQERRAAMHLAVSNDGRGHVGPGDVSIEGRVAQRLGFAERRMWAVLNESAHVSLTVADRALQNAGTGIRLWDLWPELGEEEAS